ncbi:MAG: hypothetical protein ABEI80_09875 [Haloplanus sp.]
MSDRDVLRSALESNCDRRRVLQAVGAGGLLAGLGGRVTAQAGEGRGRGNDAGVDVIAKQNQGVVHWSLPGKRRLGQMVFGTPETPRARIKPILDLLPDDSPVADLIHAVPILVGLPPKARETNSDGTAYTQTAVPTPFSDNVLRVSGRINVAYRDRRPYDLPAEYGSSPDTVSLDVAFTDPDGQSYELDVHHTIQPPIPTWETGGGVITDTWIHGTTGTESPLLPRTYTYGAFWGICDVIADGDVVNENMVIHAMTVQNMRKSNKEIVLQEEMPLAPDETFSGQSHHTQLIVPPITVGPDGPVHEAVNTGYELPNGHEQPFIHLTFESDTIVKAPFAGWSFPETEE